VLSGSGTGGNDIQYTKSPGKLNLTGADRYDQTKRLLISTPWADEAGAGIDCHYHTVPLTRMTTIHSGSVPHRV